jgi:uncharacterized protein YycO
MNNTFDAAILNPGDMLLYFEDDPVDFLIAVKTGKRIGHVEVYAGNGTTMASRNGIGVSVYPLRTSGVVCVRKPLGVFDFTAGLAWFNASAKGQPYDWKGLATFTSLVNEGEEGKMFCSEFAVNFYRACGYNPCNPSQPAYETSPRDLWVLGTFETKWALNDYYA